ncbi:MAG: class I SAM-dependent methyltransferase [Actinobacteria bacterium]|nr:class I SAM-dependent methyltransferase [Actinomycetota bacterium]
MEADDWNRRYDGADLIWTAQANRTLMAEVESLKPGRVLDLGCGEGRNAVWLASRGWEVTGVDFADVGLRKARRLAEAQAVVVEWVLADLRTYEPARSAYDLVVVLYLHLGPDHRRAVHAAAASALQPGGTIIVLGHDSSNLTDGHGGPQDPSLLFTPDDVVGDLPGLSVVKAERVVRPVPTEDGERMAIDALVRAVRGAVI